MVGLTVGLWIVAASVASSLSAQEKSHAAARVFLVHGELAFEAGDFARAVDLFAAAVAEDP